MVSAVHRYVVTMRQYGGVPTRSLTRDEIAELADRLHRLLDTTASEDVAVTTAMKHRVEGAVVALDAVLGHSSTASGSTDY
jgi:deoxyribodipyrimidine photolyase-like uncharacterized protein